jgi:hypothetical protein
LDRSDLDTRSDLDLFQVSLGNKAQVPFGAMATLD